MAKPTAPLPPVPLPVSEKAPAGACDTHVHLLGAPDEFPLFDGRTEDPAQSYAAYLAGYKAHLANLGITRGVVVQSIFYGLDNAVTVQAVRDMGDGFKGIGLLPDDATDADLDQFAIVTCKNFSIGSRYIPNADFVDLAIKESRRSAAIISTNKYGFCRCSNTNSRRSS